MREFSHDGSAGDIIYHITAVKMLGGGTFWIYPSHIENYRMNRRYAETLMTLLRVQPYLKSVGWNEHAQGTDLGHWRHNYKYRFNLSDMCHSWLGLHHMHRYDPWLTVPDVKRIAPVVINRCPRWRNDHFPWQRVYDAYGRDAVFVGHTQEHAEFCHNWGPISYHHTRDFLELAQVIAGADLFVGNQSSAASVAEGLKMPMIQETLPMDSWWSNCHWERDEKIHGTDGNAELPPLSDLRERWAGSRAKASVGNSLLTEDRLRALAHAVRSVEYLPGDMAEIGVAKGGAARVIASVCPRKTLHLFDTFTGLPTDETLAGHHVQGEFATAVADVQTFLAGHKTEFHVGVFPETAKVLTDRRYSFVHVDGDLYETTAAAIAYFWPRMVQGGIMIFDDFGSSHCPGVAKAIDEAGLLSACVVKTGNQAMLTKG
jgi:hypothetical protein